MAKPMAPTLYQCAYCGPNRANQCTWWRQLHQLSTQKLSNTREWPSLVSYSGVGGKSSLLILCVGSSWNFFETLPASEMGQIATGTSEGKDDTLIVYL
eukprot:11949524-Ditylum_brightwellii.AAC.1